MSTTQSYTAEFLLRTNWPKSARKSYDNGFDAEIYWRINFYAVESIWIVGRCCIYLSQS